MRAAWADLDHALTELGGEAQVVVGEVRGARTKEIVAQLSACLSPSCAYIGCNEVLRVVGGVPEARLCELGAQGLVAA